MAMKRARERVRVARWMAMATKRARARARAGRGMAMATKVVGDKKGEGAGNKKRAMAKGGNNTGNCYSKKGGRHSTVAMMGKAQRTRPLVLRLERGG